MMPIKDRLTLDALLADPLTQLVMRSDKLTPADVAQAFDEARAGLSRGVPLGRSFAYDRQAYGCGDWWRGC